MRERIVKELERIQREHDVRVLLAVESGSRAWGFASPDSDYDVRIIYVHRQDWYLSVFEQRDVIEEMLPDSLDVSGWDLRKTLRLFSKCNLALNEWLGSPIVYSEIEEFKTQLVSLMPQYFNSIAAIHHYRSMAESSFGENFVQGQIRIKKLFYVLRPLFACRWVERTHSQPPTEFSKLVDSDCASQEEESWIADLLRKKSAALESDSISLDEQRAHGIATELEKYKSASDLGRPPTKQVVSDLDSILRRWCS